MDFIKARRRKQSREGMERAYSLNLAFYDYDGSVDHDGEGDAEGDYTLFRGHRWMT